MAGVPAACGAEQGECEESLGGERGGGVCSACLFSLLALDGSEVAGQGGDQGPGQGEGGLSLEW